MMKKIISTIFSDVYVNKNAVTGNPLLWLMYRLAYPFSVFLAKLNLTPNQITTLSLAFSIAAFFSLTSTSGLSWFITFWLIAVLLDFCDGTVARMTNQISKTAFRYDHISDIFKISLISFGVGIRFNDIEIWMLSTSLIFFYNYSEILCHDLISIKKINQIKQIESQTHALTIDLESNNLLEKKRLRDRFILVKFLMGKMPIFMMCLIKIYGDVSNILLTFNGHTLLFFLALPVGGWVTKATLLYLICLTLRIVRSSIIELRLINR